MTAAMWAARAGRVTCLLELAQLGAHLAVADDVSADASSCQLCRVCTISSASVDSQAGMTPLMHAAENGRTGAVEEIVRLRVPARRTNKVSG